MLSSAGPYSSYRGSQIISPPMSYTMSNMTKTTDIAATMIVTFMMAVQYCDRPGYTRHFTRRYYELNQTNAFPVSRFWVHDVQVTLFMSPGHRVYAASDGLLTALALKTHRWYGMVVMYLFTLLDWVWSVVYDNHQGHGIKARIWVGKYNHIRFNEFSIKVMTEVDPRAISHWMSD